MRWGSRDRPARSPGRNAMRRMPPWTPHGAQDGKTISISRRAIASLRQHSRTRTLRRWHEDLTAAEKSRWRTSEGLAYSGASLRSWVLMVPKRLATNLRIGCPAWRPLNAPWTWNLASRSYPHAAACRLDPLVEVIPGRSSSHPQSAAYSRSRPVDLPNSCLLRSL